MSQPEAQFTRGQGGDPNNPPQPYGQATAVNKAADAAPDAPSLDLTPDEAAAVGIGGAPPPPPGNPASPTGGDRHKFMFAPTDRPNQSVTYGTTPGGRLAPPPDLHQWLPDLQDAANQPDAPPMVKMLFDAISQQLPG